MSARDDYESIRRETAKVCFARFCVDNMCVSQENRAFADAIGAILTTARNHLASGDDEGAREEIGRARALLSEATQGLDVRRTILQHVASAG